MTLCVFVLIASEFMPVSLLTPITRDLGVTEGLAGQGIAISGALAVLTSLTLSTLAGKMNRKFLQLGMTVLMVSIGAYYCAGFQLSDVYGRSCDDWCGYWRILVDVSGNGDSSGAAASGHACAGNFQRR